MIYSNLIADHLAEPRIESLKIHDLASIFADMEIDLQFSGYCYYCDICEETFVISGKLIEQKYVRGILHDRCPSCHWSLESSLCCRRIRIPTPIFHLHPSLASIKSSINSHEKLVSHIYEKDEPHRRESFYNNLIEDSLKSLLGRFVILHGDYTAHELSEFISVKAQMSETHGGLNSKVIFIDGGNLFDPYLISQYADRYQTKRDTVLDGIQIGRAFTCHQLTSLITKTLPDGLEYYQAKLAVIAGITRLYKDPDMKESEAFDTLNKVSKYLMELAEEKDAILLATCVTASKHSRLESILLSRAHIVFQIQENSKPILKKYIQRS